MSLEDKLGQLIGGIGGGITPGLSIGKFTFFVISVY